MSILGFYLARRVGATLALVWLALGTLVGVFEFLEEAGGRAPGESAVLALLGLPRLLMETLPFACAIGAAVSAALLERRRGTCGCATARIMFASARWAKTATNFRMWRCIARGGMNCIRC